MRRKLTVSLIAAVLIIALMGCAALAAANMGNIAALFAGRNTETGNPEPREDISAAVQNPNAVYEGSAVRCTVTEALCNQTDGTYALSWTLEPLTEGEALYVVRDELLFGGEPADVRQGTLETEYLLDETALCLSSGNMDGDSTECTLSFTVLKPLAEIVRVEGDEDTEAHMERIRSLDAEGYLVTEDGGYIWVEPSADTLYSDALLATGKMELADRFTLTFDIGGSAIETEARTASGQTEFVFDGYELRVTECLVTTTSAKLAVEYITDEQPGDGGKGFGTLIGLSYGVPGFEGERWYGNASGVIEDPVQLEDGRWMTLFTCEAYGLHVFPESILLIPSVYDEDLNETTLESATLTLSK